MKNLRLTVEDLAVESFSTAGESRKARGTVIGQQECSSLSVNADTCAYHWACGPNYTYNYQTCLNTCAESCANTCPVSCPCTSVCNGGDLSAAHPNRCFVEPI